MGITGLWIRQERYSSWARKPDKDTCQGYYAHGLNQTCHTGRIGTIFRYKGGNLTFLLIFAAALNGAVNGEEFQKHHIRPRRRYFGSRCSPDAAGICPGLRTVSRKGGADFRTSGGFEKYERGEFSDAEFRDFVRNAYGITVSDSDLDRCWNAMLGPIPSAKLELLTSLKASYPTFLLSNTNTIHLDYVNSVILPSQNTAALENYFHRTYYSHLMGKRKPEPEIFLQVLEENNLVASETLFLDDNPDNIAGAAAVGLQTAFVNTPDFILEYFR
jgi:haloacid dehalogenase superfamily, subfamily IA, variant 3 with third motif having DD or ED